MKRAMLLLLGLAMSSPAWAQAPYPGAVRVGNGWVPCSHPIAIKAGLGCVATAPGVPTTYPADGAVPPYGGAAGDTGLRFELGKAYREPYGGVMRVVGTITLTSGEMVFVGECLSGPQSSCPREMLLQFALDEDRGAWHWEVPLAELRVHLP